MKLAGMPAGMWMLFRRSFRDHLVSVLGFGRDEAKRVCAAAGPKYRQIIAKLPEENTYVILTGTSSHGLQLIEANEFLEGEYHPEWVYDLDGGPSTALFRRLQGKKTLKLIYGAGQRIVDVMGFVE